MTAFEKGQYVEAIVDGVALTVRGSLRRWFSEGDEFKVTAVRPGGWLNVRPGYDPILRMRGADVRPVRELGIAPEGAIDQHDPRIEWFFRDAERLANRMGLCNVYDEMMAALQAPGRPKRWTVPLLRDGGVKITATVEARSRHLAEQMVREQLVQHPPQLAIGGNS